jgi:uncharacterized membrane protein
MEMTIRTGFTRQRDGSQVGQLSYTDRISMAASILGGTALAIYGFSRRNWKGVSLAAGGAYLAYRAIAGNIDPDQRQIRIGFTINRQPDEVYNFVRDRQNWPRFIQGAQLKSEDGRFLSLTWGKRIGFRGACEAEITDEQPSQYIAWSSRPGSVDHRGVLHFRPTPGNRGTEISIAMEFKTPGAPISKAWSLLQGADPEQQIKESLRHVKQLLEAGEIPTTAGQSSGRRGIKGAALRRIYREPVAQVKTETRLAGD